MNFGVGGGDRANQLRREPGRFIGLYAVGALSDATGSFYAGLLLLPAAVFAAGVLALLGVRHDRGLAEVEKAPAATGTAVGG